MSDLALSDQHLILRDGTPVLIRRLLADDIALYPDFLREVTAEDLRLRFFVSMQKISENLIDKLIHYDPARAMAFIAVDEQSQKMLGVVRLHDDAGGDSGEFAILVRSRLKVHGIGWLLMKCMIEFARSKGLKIVHGEVLAENITMLAMCNELGFQIKTAPDELGVKLVTLKVTKSAPPSLKLLERKFMNNHHFHAVVWIDHREARIFHFSSTDVEKLVLRPDHPTKHIHHKANSIGSGHVSEDQNYFHAVTQAIADAGAVLITGPANAKIELIKHIHHHDPARIRNIAGVETVDHPSDASLIVYARTYFKAADRMEPQQA